MDKGWGKRREKCVLPKGETLAGLVGEPAWGIQSTGRNHSAKAVGRAVEAVGGLAEESQLDTEAGQSYGNKKERVGCSKQVLDTLSFLSKWN